LSNSGGETIYLEKLDSQRPVVVDSAALDDQGNFVFNSYAPPLGFYRIRVTDRSFGMLVLDSSDKVTVTGNAKDLGNTYKVQGSPETKLFLEYNDLNKVYQNQNDSLKSAFQMAMQSVKMDSLRMDSLSKVFEKPYLEMRDRFTDQLAAKIRANTNMFSSIMAVQPLDPDKYSDVFKALDEGLGKKYPENNSVRMFRQAVSRLVSARIGQEAPELSLATPEGGQLKLSSLRGKIVMIDFWASWCGPCRKDMPHVKEVYAKYKSKGFEILGVSLDREKQDWVEAIKKDGLSWPQISDLKFWDSEAARLYNVQSIPHTVLVDKEGKILAKGLRGPELDKALEAIFSGKTPAGGATKANESGKAS
ncbi:MAG: redoxin domain-containing protein, partial [Bacteroidia bacterium]